MINPQVPGAADRVLAKLESLQRAGRLEEAERSCRNALIEHPANAQILRRFGLILGARGRADEALDALRRATEADPACVDCFVALAALLNDLGRSAEALEASERGLAVDPHSYFATVCRALVLHRLGRLDESIEVWRHAIDLRPQRVQAHAGLAEALLAADQPTEAERAARRALELQPGHPQALFALGNAFYFSGRAEDAIEPLHRALAQKPGNSAIALNLGLAYLTLGRYAEAWPHYEMRLKRSPEKNLAIGMTYAQPPWDGSEPHGKTVLVHAEQGYGDILQFVRFLPALAERGVRAILRVDRKLCALLQHSFPAIPIVPLDEPTPEFDSWLPLASLGRLLSVSLESLPGSVSYLLAEMQKRWRWRERLGPRRGTLRIGVAWAGSPVYGADRKRSLPLEAFAHLASVPNTELYSLQYGPQAVQAEQCQTFDIQSLGEDIAPFDELAALMCELDLVISVDTGAAHLAAGLGVPCWILLRAVADWRWLRARSDSPWYPSVRLFWQRAPGDWTDPILEAADALREAVRNGRISP